MDIFRKIGAVMTAGTMAFSGIAVNTQYVSAENEVFPETMIIENYTGYFQRSFNIDIDNDGQKEEIGYYYIGSQDRYAISDVYYVYNGGSEPYTLYKRINNVHKGFKLHVVQDNNTGETFLGYIYKDMFKSSALYKFSSDKQEQLVFGYFGPDSGKSDDGVSLEEYYAYMDNVTFLDQTAYGKGDIDGDADITISDASTILSCYAYNLAGLPLEINDIQKDAADMDKDGEITISDASTALSLYAESAAGIIDTTILPSTVKEDEINGHSLVTGNLESTFYLDIDNDGVKETIGRYDSTNLYDSSSKDINVLAQPYLFQVYDNGTFSGSFGFDPSGGMCYIACFLVNDHNINQTYLASITHRCVAMYGSATISKAYPVAVGNAQSSVLNVYKHCTESEGTININRESATRQEILDYINNLEIINPYKNEDESLSIFEYIFDTYSE